MKKASRDVANAVHAMGAEELKAQRGARIRAALFAVFALAAFAAATVNSARWQTCRSGSIRSAAPMR
ncbi:MAG: hypothetical protein ACO27T_01870 [Candidatus Limnocylindrus sp.]